MNAYDYFKNSIGLQEISLNLFDQNNFTVDRFNMQYNLASLF